MQLMYSHEKLNFHSFFFYFLLSSLLKEESDMKEQQKVGMGCLFDSISGEGSSSRAGITKPADWRLGARFRRIPALENLDGD